MILCTTDHHASHFARSQWRAKGAALAATPVRKKAMLFRFVTLASPCDPVRCKISSRTRDQAERPSCLGSRWDSRRGPVAEGLAEEQ